ncbi:hypothetical protein ACQ4PT_010769 [Festuca glaucescens]
MKAKVASRAGGDSFQSVSDSICGWWWCRLAVKKSKAEKDPNKPKRPPSAFFVFMEGFRKDYKEKNPNNKQVSVVGKAGGEKWKSLTDDEKAPYVAKAEKLKAEYAKKIDAYNNPQAEASGDSDKSKSEINDEEDASEVRPSTPTQLTSWRRVMRPSKAAAAQGEGSQVGKAGGEKWKSLTDDEKAPYVAKAEKLKAEYAKKIDAYNNPQAEASGDSDKSKSEINDEEDASEGDE